MGDSGDFDISRREVLRRGIEHELLLHSGDSIPRVLPVEKFAENDARSDLKMSLVFNPTLW
jgi:hypothetical protein